MLNKKFQKYPGLSSISNIGQELNEYAISLNLVQINNLIEKHQDKVEITQGDIIIIEISKDDNYAQWIGFDIEYKDNEEDNSFSGSVYFDNALGILSLSDIGIKKIKIPENKINRLGDRKSHLILLKTI